MKPESYPFLRIARQYNVPYENVLIVVDWYRTRNTTKIIAIPNNVLDVVDNMKASCLRDIRLAYITQKMIRDGEIDWMTGERLK